MKNKRTLVITIAVLLIVLVGVTATYAYISVFGKSQNQEISVGTGKIHLVFSDTETNSINGTLKLGESITKSFKIENKGTKPGRVQIQWNNLVNTYMSRSLSYKLETSPTGTEGTYTEIEAEREYVPRSKEPITKELSKEIEVPVGNNPIYYRVIITLNNQEDVNQLDDINASLSTKFSLISSNESATRKTLAALKVTPKTSSPNFTKTSPTLIYKMVPSTSNSTRAMSADTYMTYSSEIDFDNKTGLFSLKNPVVKKYSEVYNSLAGKYIASFGNTTGAMDSYTNKSTVIKVVSATSSSMVWAHTTSTTDEENYLDEDSGVYPMMDDYGTSYYYRGAIQNNYVKFGKFKEDLYIYLYEGDEEYGDPNKYNGSGYKTLTECQADLTDDPKEQCYKIISAGDDIWWRIIRVNGDGSIRMIFDGHRGFKNTEKSVWRRALGSAAYYANVDIKYVGYMFNEGYYSTSKEEARRNEVDSEPKIFLDKWYEDHLLNTAYEKYLGNEIFCGDRSISTGLGYGENRTEFMGNVRVNGNPSFKCPEDTDKFSVNSDSYLHNEGNGALKYPIATISMDEVLAAGITPQASTKQVNSMNYLYKGVEYFTMTPRNGSRGGVMFAIIDNGTMYDRSNYNGRNYLAPVINISPEYSRQITGQGTIESPFVIPGAN